MGSHGRGFADDDISIPCVELGRRCSPGSSPPPEIIAINIRLGTARVGAGVGGGEAE